MSPETVQKVLDTFSKRQRTALRQRYGSIPIHYIKHDEDRFVTLQYGGDVPVVQKTFWIRENGRIVYEKTTSLLRD